MKHGTATGIHTSGGKLKGVRIGQRDLACDVCVIAMGPWTGVAGDWLPTRVPVKPFKGETVYLQGVVPRLPCSINWRFGITHKLDVRLSGRRLAFAR